MGLCLVVPDSTPARFANRQLVSLPSDEIFNKFLSLIDICLPFSVSFKGHCHGILASFYNAEICSCVNGNPKIMMQFCYLGLYHYTETIYCCLSLRMARMEVDWKKKKLASFFQILEPFLENIARNSLWFAI